MPMNGAMTPKLLQKMREANEANCRTTLSANTNWSMGLKSPHTPTSPNQYLIPPGALDPKRRTTRSMNQCTVNTCPANVKQYPTQGCYTANRGRRARRAGTSKRVMLNNAAVPKLYLPGAHTAHVATNREGPRLQRASTPLPANPIDHLTPDE